MAAELDSCTSKRANGMKQQNEKVRLEREQEREREREIEREREGSTWPIYSTPCVRERERQ